MLAKVLVVDDEQDFRDLFAEMLSRMGYAVMTASDGPEALKLMAEKSFDAAVIDFQMPGMTGVELLRKAKALDNRLSVILITGLESQQMATEALREGASELIVKPIDFDKLEATIRRVMTECAG